MDGCWIPFLYCPGIVHVASLGITNTVIFDVIINTYNFPAMKDDRNQIHSAFVLVLSGRVHVYHNSCGQTTFTQSRMYLSGIDAGILLMFLVTGSWATGWLWPLKTAQCQCATWSIFTAFDNIFFCFIFSNPPLLHEKKCTDTETLNEKGKILVQGKCCVLLACIINHWLIYIPTTCKGSDPKE